jgi:hypothetical protein
MKSTKPKTKQPKPVRKVMRVMRADFQLLTVLKDDLFTKKGKIRKNAQKGLTALIKYDAHNFIEAQDFDSIMANATIEYEEVEVLDEN